MRGGRKKGKRERKVGRNRERGREKREGGKERGGRERKASQPVSLPWHSEASFSLPFFSLTIRATEICTKFQVSKFRF